MKIEKIPVIKINFLNRIETYNKECDQIHVIINWSTNPDNEETALSAAINCRKTFSTVETCRAIEYLINGLLTKFLEVE